MDNIEELLNMKDKDIDEKLRNMSLDELQNLYEVLYKEFNKSIIDFIKHVKEYNHE